MARNYCFDYVLLERAAARTRNAAIPLASALLVTACTTTQPPAPTRGPVVERPPVERPDSRPDPDTPGPTPQDPIEPVDTVEIPDTNPIVTRDGLTPPHMAGRDIKRLALVLPFSASNARLREEADSMLKAAELAVFDHPDNDLVLIALDSQGTDNGALSAAQAAQRAGADVILGPILASSVRAASMDAQRNNIPIVAFSTDQTVAGNGTYLLSFPPEAEIDRVVEYAASEGATRFAFIGPDSEYGRRANAAYSNSVARIGGQVTANEIYYGRDITAMQDPAQRIARYYVQTERETGSRGLQAFEAILLPEGGTPLRSLAPLLLYNNINNSAVQFMGTGLWNREDTVREPALNGGIFAGPDQDSRERFMDKYERAYGSEPSSLASLAYDAVIAGSTIADGDPRSRRARAEDPTGFYGADGLIRFRSDGTPERGLAIFRIEDGEFVVVEPAPKTASGAF